MKRIVILALVLTTLLMFSGCYLVLKCVDFEGFAVGTQYHNGDVFSELTTQMVMKPFFWFNGTLTPNGVMTVTNAGMSGHAGKDVNLNNITISFKFPVKPSGLILYYGEYGGNINVEINGVLENVQDFSDINGKIIGGVSVTLTGVSGPKGILNLQGTITSFSIGGQELWIDHICPRK